MPTQDILVPIDFGGGIDQTADPKRTIPTKLTDLRNARLEYGKRISKRFGMRRVAEAIDKFTATRIVGDLMAALGDELVIQSISATDSPDIVYSTGNSGFQNFAASMGNRNIGPTLEAARIGLQPQSGDSTLIDSAVSGGLTLFAYEESFTQCTYALIDNTTGALLVQPTKFTSAARPRVITTASGFIFAHVNTATNNLEFRLFLPGSSTDFSGAATTATLVNVATPNWDWDINAAGTSVYVAYNSSTATTIRFANVAAATGVVSGASSFATTAAPDALCMAANGNTNPFIAYHDTTDGLRLRYIAGAFTGANHLINASVTVIEALTSTVITGANGEFVLMAQYTATGTTNRFVTMHRRVNAAPPTNFGNLTNRACGLISKAFTRNNRACVLAVHDSPLQPQTVLLELPKINWSTQALTRARILFGETFGLVTRPHLSAANVFSSNVWQAATIRRERTFVQGKTFFATTTPGEIKIDFNAPGTCRAVEIAETLTFASGIVGLFDGAPGIVEQNYFMGPEIVTAAQSAGGGTVADGTYQVVALYEWTDAKGKLHRSQPSVPVSVTIAGGGGVAKIAVTLPPLRVTDKDPVSMGVLFGTQNRIQQVRIAVYRTTNTGTLFFRSSNTPSNSTSNVSLDTVVENSTVDDATLQSRDLLYTTGGILPFWSPNSCSAICATADRVFVNDLGDPSVVYFSNKLTAGEPVEFSQALYLRFGSGDGGKVTALAAMDDKITIWKKRQLWITSGQGPDGTGQFGSFADPQRLPFDGGADSQASVISMPMGVVVKGANGFNLLGRDLSWTYIGAAVRTYDTATVVSSVLLVDAQEVRFILNNGTVLVYNYQFLGPDGIGQWSVTNFSALDACYTKSGRFYALESSSRNLYVEDPTIFYDTAAAITDYSLSITTAWIMTSGIQGFQRVKKLLLLGDVKDTHNLQVEIAYDFIETWDPTPYTIAQNALGLLQLAVQPRKQKCEAIRFRITDPTNIGAASRENYDITAMTMLIGVTPGTYRTTAAQRAK